jgi:hypothetical protein
MRLTKVNFKLEIWTRPSGDLDDSKAGAQFKAQVLVQYYASQSIPVSPTIINPLGIDIWPAYGRKVGDLTRSPGRAKKKDRDCALQIDNAKDMTLPICSSHLTYSSKLSRL